MADAVHAEIHNARNRVAPRVAVSAGGYRRECRRIEIANSIFNRKPGRIGACRPDDTGARGVAGNGSGKECAGCQIVSAVQLPAANDVPVELTLLIARESLVD